MGSPRPVTSREEREHSPVAEAPSSGDVRPLSGPVRSEASSTPPPPAGPQWTLVARLIRPHGRRGELVADILTDFPGSFRDRRVLWLMPQTRSRAPLREVLLENFWFLRSRIVLKFHGIDSINDAEALRGFGVAIPSAQRIAVEDGSVYVSELIGCRVIDLGTGATDIGEVVDLDRGSSSTDLLVVRRRVPGSASSEALIPFVREYVVRMDTANRVIEVRLPEGLLEINAPMTEEEKRQMQG